MKKRIVSFLMAALMAVSLLPTAVWAEALEDETSEVSQTPHVSDAQSYATADTPAVCSDTDVDTALKDAGFTVPTMGTNFNVDVPCWSEYTDLCELDWYSSTGEMTLTLKEASSEAWNAAYQQSIEWSDDYSKVMCVTLYYAPGLAYDDAGNWSSDACYYSVCMTQDSDEALYFINHFAESKDGYGGNPVDYTSRGVTIADVNTTKGTITNTTDATYYYMVVWYDANDIEIAKYATKINVTSATFSYPTTGKTVDEMLLDTDFAYPTADQLYVDMPEGLEKDTDYSVSYDQTTGHMTVKILPGDPEHWQQAFETLLDRYDFEEACDWFAAIMGFEQVANANKLICYFADQDDSAVGSFINGDYVNWFDWYAGTDLRPGSDYTFADISRDGNSNITISVPQGSGWVRCIAVWADSSGNVLNKFMYTLSIEADESFTVQWTNTPLEEQLKDAGFTYPTMSDGDTNWDYGCFCLGVPKGLVEDTDYSYSYDRTTGTLTINMMGGEYNDWKAAYLNNVISEPETAYIDFGVYFSPAQEKVDLVASVVGREEIQALLRDEYPNDERFYFEDINCGRCGNGFAGVWLERNDDKITLRADQGTEELIYAVVWEDHDTRTVVAGYMLKVVINVVNDFSHTIKTPQVRDITADRITVDNTNITGGASAWNIINKNGQLAFMPASGQTLAGIMNGKTHITDFTIEAPDGYTLQSYYVRQFRDGSNMEDLNPANQTFQVDTHDNLVGSNTGVVGGTLRYTLRWSSNDPSQPDLVEKLNVRIGDYALGKTVLTGDTEKDSEINIVDVQNMYEHMTESQTTSESNGNDTDQVDPELATYDINFDGSADVYDLQRLYEAVAQDKTLQ